MFTFMGTCDTRACYVTSWVGWGGGDVHVHVNLRHTRMLRHVLGWVGWGGCSHSCVPLQEKDSTKKDPDSHRWSGRNVEAV